MKSSIRREVRTYLNNKFERPFQSSHPIHIVWRADPLAFGGRSFLGAQQSFIRSYVPRLCRRLGGRLQHWSLNSNHIHAVASFKDRASFLAFVRGVASRIARVFKCAGLWLKRPYSRVLTWGREVKNVIGYVQRNCLEAVGRIPYIPRERSVPAQIKVVVSQTLAPHWKEIERQGELL